MVKIGCDLFYISNNITDPYLPPGPYCQWHLKERTSAWWDNFVSETVVEEEWWENFRMSRKSLYRLAHQLRVNAGGRANSIWIRDLWTWKFWNRQWKIVDSNYPDTCAGGFNFVLSTPILNMCINQKRQNSNSLEKKHMISSIKETKHAS